MNKNKKEIRNKFKQSVFQRDNYTCLGCKQFFNENNAYEFLDAHHITDRNEMPNGGYIIENGISLCKEECHIKAEKFHISNGNEWEEGFHPDDLYELINSTKEIAIEKSNEL